jgi:chemotaxis protein methyltransferase CheR
VSPSPELPLLAVPLEGDDEQLERLKLKIQTERGFNCKWYKDKCLRRRLAVRMRARGTADYAAYSALLDGDAAEYDHLLDTLTINVTKFFRNMDTWDAVRESVLPHLFARNDRQLRVWSAGAASGEEAYTVSMLLHDHGRRTGQVERVGRFRIVGTDIDRRSLEAARAGEYPELSLTETPEEFREEWFSPGPPFRLRAEARRNVSFLRRDLISEEPEREQHLILCRNVVIYFDREIQERLFQIFYESLVPGGFLVLGKVETLLGSARSLFRPINNRERIFQRPG